MQEAITDRVDETSQRLAALPRDIVFASLVEWGRMPYWRWRSLFRAVALAGHRVLWVDHFSSWGKREMLHSLRSDPWRLRPRLKEEEPGIFVLATPVRIPAGEGLAARWARAVSVSAVRRAARRLQFGRPLLWIAGPPARALIHRLDERAVIYDCLDDLASVGAQKSVVAEEAKLIPQVGLVWTCMPSVARLKEGFGPPVVCIPNGVDPEHFLPALGPGPIPPRLASLPRPIVGYAGMLYDRLDWDLVRLVCQSEPTWSVVFVGRVESKPPAWTTDVPNLHLVGEVPFADLPAHYRAMDVCWVPHKLNTVTARQSSLKVLEYLAAGRPTVVTEIPLEPDVRAIVETASDLRQLLAALRHAMGQDTVERRRARAETARRHSWANRFQQLTQAIAPIIQ